jgi:hypothetical protein
MYGSCDRPCRISFRARIQSAPSARAAARTIQRRGVFRRRGAARRLPSKGTAERRLRLRRTSRAVRTLKCTLHREGRVAVVIVAKVRGTGGTGGTRTVTRRIVLKRAARSAAPGGARAGGFRAP